MRDAARLSWSLDCGGRNSVGRVSASQAECRGFEPLRPLQYNSRTARELRRRAFMLSARERTQVATMCPCSTSAFVRSCLQNMRTVVDARYLARAMLHESWANHELLSSMRAPTRLRAGIRVLSGKEEPAALAVARLP